MEMLRPLLQDWLASVVRACFPSLAPTLGMVVSVLVGRRSEGWMTGQSHREGSGAPWEKLRPWLLPYLKHQMV